MNEPVLDISLTSFTDYLLRVGMSKLTEAHLIREQYLAGYKQYKDYYRPFRRAVRAIHRQNRPVHDLDQLPPTIPDLRGKRTNYELMARGYKRFWATNYQEMDFRWTRPARATWRHDRLSVRVNPELAFTNGQETHLLKLYLKKEKPTREQVRLIMHLMQITLRQQVNKPLIGLVDIRRARFFEETAFDPRLTVLLEGEAAGFVQMYRSIESFLELQALNGGGRNMADIEEG